MLTEENLRRLSLVLWITYFSTYLGRLNFSATLSQMSASGFSKADLGLIAAFFFAAYALGQVLAGFLGDKVTPRLLVFGGLACGGCVNLLFPLWHSAGVLTVLWCVNGLAQAFIWPPMLRLISNHASAAQCRKLVLQLSTTGPAGMLCSYGLSALMIRVGGWQACFWPVGLWMLAVAIAGLAAVGHLESAADVRTVEPVESKRALPINTHMILISGLWAIIVASLLHGMLKDGLSTWIPTYLGEVFMLKPQTAVLLTMTLPVINLSGVWLADFLNKQILKNEILSALCFFALSLSALAVIVAAGNSLLLTVLMFGAVTSGMLAVNTLLISFVPIHFRSVGAVATVSGILNSATYGGSALASVLLGWAAGKFDWGGVLWLLCAFSAAGILACVLAGHGWKRYRQKRGE